MKHRPIRTRLMHLSRLRPSRECCCPMLGDRQLLLPRLSGSMLRLVVHQQFFDLHEVPRLGWRVGREGRIHPRGVHQLVVLHDAAAIGGLEMKRELSRGKRPEQVFGETDREERNQEALPVPSGGLAF